MRVYLTPAVSQTVLSQQLPLGDQGSAMSMDTSNVVRNANPNGPGPSWDNALVQPFSASQGLLFTIIMSFKKLITYGENYNFSHMLVVQVPLLQITALVA
jgi:hypothetical protein